MASLRAIGLLLTAATALAKADTPFRGVSLAVPGFSAFFGGNKNDLNASVWTGVAANVSVVGTAASITDASAGTGSRFYRVMVVR